MQDGIDQLSTTEYNFVGDLQWVSDQDYHFTGEPCLIQVDCNSGHSSWFSE
jgi:hypothetical protein